MSDKSISVVPEMISFPGKEAKAESIRNWLIENNVIQSVLSDCVLSSGLGYSIGNEAKLVVKEPNFLPNGLKANGMEIITQRTIFHADELDTIVCPECKSAIPEAGIEAFASYHNDGNSNLKCSVCKAVINLNNLIISPVLGFCDLGFTFWNWPPFKEDFIELFENKLGCKIRIIYSSI
jgi:hypothetical protein